jgi:predicted DNA-binding transcriptional regulator AlpA
MQTSLTVKQVASRYGVDTCTIWRWRKSQPGFPAPHRFGPQTLRWKITDLEAWEETNAPEEV